jgi:hypothetical protein
MKTDWSPHIERTVRNAAAVLVAVYTAGYILGEWVHALNDAIANMIKPAPAPMAPPAIHPLMAIADDMQTYTVKQLQAMVGTKRRMRKAELIAQLVTC